MRYLSVCSGIESASVAWHPLGWQCAGVAEIEPFPCQVLAQRLGATRPRYMPDPEAEGLPAKDAKARANMLKAMAHPKMRYYVANAPMRRRWPALVMAGVIVCGAMASTRVVASNISPHLGVTVFFDGFRKEKVSEHREMASAKYIPINNVAGENEGGLAGSERKIFVSGERVLQLQLPPPIYTRIENQLAGGGRGHFLETDLVWSLGCKLQIAATDQIFRRSLSRVLVLRAKIGPVPRANAVNLECEDANVRAQLAFAGYSREVIRFPRLFERRSALHDRRDKAGYPNRTENKLPPSPARGPLVGIRSAPLSAQIGSVMALWVAAWLLLFRSFECILIGKRREALLCFLGGFAIFWVTVWAISPYSCAFGPGPYCEEN